MEILYKIILKSSFIFKKKWDRKNPSNLLGFFRQPLDIEFLIFNNEKSKFNKV